MTFQNLGTNWFEKHFATVMRQHNVKFSSCKLIYKSTCAQQIYDFNILDSETYIKAQVKAKNLKSS